MLGWSIRLIWATDLWLLAANVPPEPLPLPVSKVSIKFENKWNSLSPLAKEHIFCHWFRFWTLYIPIHSNRTGSVHTPLPGIFASLLYLSRNRAQTSLPREVHATIKKIPSFPMTTIQYNFSTRIFHNCLSRWITHIKNPQKPFNLWMFVSSVAKLELRHNT